MSGVTVMSGLLILTAGVFLHVGLLRATRSNDGWIDLKIYRQTGELVASRINPYDQAQMSSSSLIQGIRTRDDLYDPWASSPENFDYYVTSNLPGSTLFYGALAWKGNSPLLWRLVLLIGIVALFLLSADYVRRVQGRISPSALLAVGVLTLFNPMLAIWGTVLPEEEHLQVFLVIALLIALRTRNPSQLVSHLHSASSSNSRQSSLHQLWDI